jgi:nucleolar protein 9
MTSEGEAALPPRFGSKEFKSNGPISILAADGNRYQLDDATNEYFVEIEKALGEFDEKRNVVQQRGEEDDIDDKDEAIETLANNALEGADGREVELMMDARCSRLIERLVAHATDEALASFLKKVCRGWKTYALAMNIFGSRVLESVIRQVSKRLVVDGEGNDGSNPRHHGETKRKKRSIQEVLKFKEMLLEKEDVDDGFENENRSRNNDYDDGGGEGDGQQQQRENNNLPEAGPRSCLDNLSYVLSSRAKDIAFDQRASPVARRVFFLLAGKEMPLNPGGRDKTLAVGQQNYKPQGNLESKLKGATSVEQFDASKKNREKYQEEKNEDRINAFPELLESHINDVLANVEEVLWDMTDDPCASAYLQAILISQEGDDKSLKWIIPGLLGCAPPEDAPDGELLADLSSEDMKTLMQSRSGSHLLEVIVKVAPKTLGSEIWRRFFRDKLMSISKHPVANFVLQSVLGSSRDPAVVASAVSELSALFGTLLYDNRAGVIAALLAACLRLKTNEKDCCKALARGVTFKLEKKNATNEEGGEGGRKGGKSQLARALLFLGNPPHGRCSVLGAAMMQTLAKYPADATIMFLESLCDTDPKSLLQASRDASGSHAIEAILNSRLVKAKHKKAIAELLVDNAVALAVSSGGSRVLEACYRETDNKTKKKIVELCSAREKEIVATRHGMVLFKRLGVKQFQNNASGWEKREEKSAAIRAEFEKEFGFDSLEEEKKVREVPPPPSRKRDEKERDPEDEKRDRKKSKKEKKEKKDKKEKKEKKEKKKRSE